MTILKQNRISMIAGTAILTIALAFGGYSFASHSFEAGVSGDNIPDNTHILLNDIKLKKGDVLPLYDASPNYVTGHILLSSPCEPISKGDDTYQPKVSLVAGHVDESAEGTYLAPVPLYYISFVSNAPDTCIFHAHIPDPINDGSTTIGEDKLETAPKVTDIALINLSDKKIKFKGTHMVDINIQSVLGSISGAYHDGPHVDLSRNMIYDLNDDDNTNDGFGHSGGN